MSTNIWFQPEISIDELNKIGEGTLSHTMKMQFVDKGDDYLTMSMPVAKQVHQPFGILHGGASAALAETVGSMAAWCTVDRNKFYCVGLDINCNHIRSKKDGIVTATARPFHIGRTTQVWEIKILDENAKLVCISRLTMAVVPIV